MVFRKEPEPSPQPGLWQSRLKARWSRLQARLRRVVPFAGGIGAAFLGLFFYNLINPPPAPMTPADVNQAVVQAMSAATQAPAYSAQVYRIIQPSLVWIQTKSQNRNGNEHDGLGSGVVVTAEGQILTALHVVEDASEIKITFADGMQTTAQVVTTQPENDIAVLLADELPEQVYPAVLGNPGNMRVGDEAYAVGNPFGLYSSMSAGVISGFDRTFQGEGSEQSLEGLIQIDTAVNPGNSGGPLLNRAGQVVGIVIGILNPTER